MCAIQWHCRAILNVHVTISNIIIIYFDPGSSSLCYFHEKILVKLNSLLFKLILGSFVAQDKKKITSINVSDIPCLLDANYLPVVE